MAALFRNGVEHDHAAVGVRRPGHLVAQAEVVERNEQEHPARFVVKQLQRLLVSTASASNVGPDQFVKPALSSFLPCSFWTYAAGSMLTSSLLMPTFCQYP